MPNSFRIRLQRGWGVFWFSTSGQKRPVPAWGRGDRNRCFDHSHRLWIVAMPSTRHTPWLWCSKLRIGQYWHDLDRFLLWLRRSAWLLLQLTPFFPTSSSRMLVLRYCQVIDCHEGLLVRASHCIEAGLAKPQAAIRSHGRDATGRTFLLLGRPAWFLLARAL
jgi:hypothetical protein